MYKTRLTAYWLLWLLTLSGCVNLPGYDQRAYENATSLKPKTLALLEKSKIPDSYDGNEEKAEELLIELRAAFEYANGIEYNNEAARNWRDLIGSDDEMIVGWLTVWKAQGQVSPAAADALAEQLAEGFDTIICLEANKRQLSACPSLE